MPTGWDVPFEIQHIDGASSAKEKTPIFCHLATGEVFIDARQPKFPRDKSIDINAANEEEAAHAVKMMWRSDYLRLFKAALPKTKDSLALLDPRVNPDYHKMIENQGRTYWADWVNKSFRLEVGEPVVCVNLIMAAYENGENDGNRTD